MTTTVTTPPATRPASVTGNPQAFDAAKADWQAWMQTAVPQLNTQSAEVDTSLGRCSAYADSAGESATTTTAAAQAALAGANFKGAWASLTGALNTPATVQHNGQVWMLTANLANVTTATPGVSSSWAPYSAVHPIDRADLAGVVQPTLDLNFAEQSYRVYDAATGGLQSVALSSILTYTGSGREYVDALGILRGQTTNVPRIEFDPITGAGRGLSVWAARTNMALRSEEADSATWASKTAYTVTANAATAPDGSMNADHVIGDGTTNGSHDFGQAITGVLGTAYVISVYLKAGALPRYRLAARFSSNWTIFPSAIFDLSNGTVVSSTGDKAATIENVGNGWYRCAIYGTCANATASGIAGGPIPAGATSNTYDGVANPGGCYVWGFQFEAGTTPSPYIPTTTAAVTAPVDAAQITGSNFSKWFNPAEGTLVVLFRSSEISNQVGIAALGDPSKAFGAADTMYLQHDAALGRVGLIVFDNAITQSSMSPANSYSYGAQACAAMSYANNSFALVTSGSTASTDASGAVPTVTALSVANLAAAWSGGGNHLNGTVARVLYFPRRLPNETLQALSAI